jgi:hypothetical protein
MAESVGEHTFARQLASLRAEPSEEAEQVTQALAGEPLGVLEERGEWVRVETAYAYPGWARRVDLGGKADAGWLRPVAIDPVEHAPRPPARRRTSSRNSGSRWTRPRTISIRAFRTRPRAGA